MITLALFISKIFTPFGFNIFNDAPAPWQLGFQDSAAPGFTGLVTLHNTIGFYLIVISFAVFWVLFSIVYYYSSNKNPIAHKYLTHGTVLELIWTITPALILIAIAFPSFRLLYLMDNPGLFPNLALTTLAIIPNIARRRIPYSFQQVQEIHNQINLYSQISYIKNNKASWLGSELNIKETRAKVSISKIISPTTDVVPFGVTGANYNIRLNKHSRDITVFNKNIISQLVGHLLGDGSIHYSRTSVTPYFVFTQTIKRFEYIWSVFNILSPYCGRVPIFNLGLRKGIYSPFIQVMTRSYPALIPLHDLFYRVSLNGKNYTKVITIDLLQYLNPVSLAY